MIKKIVGTLGVAVMLMAAGMPAQAQPNYGTRVDTACRTFNGTSPYTTSGCALCHTGSYSSRVEPAWTWYLNNQLTNFCPATVNQAPNGVIDMPAANTSIVAGQAVHFMATGTDPDNNTPLRFTWDFQGGATATTLEDPGDVIFNAAGTYVARLTVTDALGTVDPTPATRTITVTAPTANQAPNGTITSPAGDTRITAGQVVNFTASGTDADANLPLVFRWSFGGAGPNVIGQNPGQLTFPTPGSYVVTLTVSDSLGLADPTPATRTVTVDPAAVVTPVGTINTPTATVTIRAGESVNFTGSGASPNNRTPLRFRWSFGGTVGDILTEDPGAVVFPNSGIFVVTMTVTDSAGVSDPNPPQRTVIVNPGPIATLCTDADKDGFFAEGGRCGPRDCNDRNASINPGAAEICTDGVDNDCDGATDSADSECNGKDCFNKQAQILQLGITAATWSAGSRTLNISGTYGKPGSYVAITNADSGVYQGTALVGADGKWQLTLVRPSIIPCRVTAQVDGLTTQLVVANAAGICNIANPGGVTPVLTIGNANWSRSNRQLTVAGTFTRYGQSVTVTNADSGAYVGTAVVNARGNWTFTAYRPSVIPCRVKAQNGTVSAIRAVANSTGICNAGAATGGGDDDDDSSEEGDSDNDRSNNDRSSSSSRNDDRELARGLEIGSNGGEASQSGDSGSGALDVGMLAILVGGLWMRRRVAGIVRGG